MFQQNIICSRNGDHVGHRSATEKGQRERNSLIKRLVSYNS